jgi:DNA-binding XRE family transcriptional regulator
MYRDDARLRLHARSGHDLLGKINNLGYLFVSRLPTSSRLQKRSKRLGAALARIRQGQHLSQPELAQRAGVSLDTLRALEQHRSGNPGVFLIVDLAQALGVPVEELTK